MPWQFKLPEITCPLSIGTIGMMLATGSELSIHCNRYDCHHWGYVNLVQLAKKLGMDHSCLDPDIRPYFHCSRCRAQSCIDGAAFGLAQGDPS